MNCKKEEKPFWKKSWLISENLWFIWNRGEKGYRGLICELM